ncbi:hypothetical protein [Rhodococcus globerulus]|uniref:hypothetical protein n=1 Tax=Rhodococcus globerulus TaxID=33008 RepID=UPI003019161B
MERRSGRVRELTTHVDFDVDDLCRRIETIAHSTVHVTDGFDAIVHPARQPIDSRTTR